MGAPKKASSKGFHTPANQSAGILDDHAVRKNIFSRTINAAKIIIKRLATMEFNDSWTYLSGNGLLDTGCDIKLPESSNKGIYIGYGQAATDKTYFGTVGDTYISGDGSLHFTGSQTIAGITNTNLLDKSATESISGAYTMTADSFKTKNIYPTSGNSYALGSQIKYWNQIFVKSIKYSTTVDILTTNLLDKSAAETVTGAWNFNEDITIPVDKKIIFGDGFNNYIMKGLFVSLDSNLVVGTFGGILTLISNLDVNLAPSGNLQINGVAGWSGTFTNGDGATVTVTKGIITNVV